MAAPGKVLHVLGMLAKAESTYGTYVAQTTTADGVQLQYADRNVGAMADILYDYDGAIGPSVSVLGQRLRVAPSGKSIEGEFPMRAVPAGVAYSAAIVPSIHTMLKANGFDATVSTGAGTEKWTYTPTPAGTTYGSTSASLYSRGELTTVAGFIGSPKLDFSNPQPPIWTFGMKGIINAMPTDVALPTITYPLQTIAPPLASAILFTMGSLSTNAVVYSGSFDFGRELSPRVGLSGSGAHLGFVPGDFKPQFTITLEATALATTPFTSSTGFDPYQLRDVATQFACSIRFGSTQYNKFTLSFPQAQVIDVKPSNNGPIATVDLTIAAANSTASANDSCSITFD